MAGYTSKSIEPSLARLFLRSPDHAISTAEARRTLAAELKPSAYDNVVLKAGIPRWWHRVHAKIDGLRKRSIVTPKNAAQPRQWSLIVPKGLVWANSHFGEQSRRSAHKPIPAVRILPMDFEEEFFDYSGIKEVQQRYFLSVLPLEQAGHFNYRQRSLRAAPGTVVLFQCSNHIIASAKFLGFGKPYKADKTIYSGSLRFDPASINVFSPENLSSVQKVWPAIVRFTHAKQKLDPERYASFNPKNVEFSGQKGRSLIDLNEDREGEIASEIEDDPNLPSTVKQQVVQARRGQGKFRKRITERKCRLSNISAEEFLLASHIKPWRFADNRERLDGANGLLLAPHADYLFDKGFVTFLDDGTVQISAELKPELLTLLGLDLNQIQKRPFSQRHRPYLKYHREQIFRK